MEERVQCAECGNQYDSNENAFCPRCGSVPRSGGTHAPVAPGVSLMDPSLRRLRAAGLVLMILGGLAAAQFLYLAVLAPGPDEPFLDQMSTLEAFASQPGGTLRLQLTHAVGNVSIETTAPNGSILHASTAGPGAWYNVSLETTFSNITLTQGNTSSVLRVYLPAGNSLTTAANLTTEATNEEPRWLVADTSAVVRTLAGFAILFSLIVVMGGLAAWKRKTRGLAILGGILAVFPGLIVIAFQPLAGFMLVLPGAIALALIVAGKRHFQKKGE